jgi:hypothetical protein
VDLIAFDRLYFTNTIVSIPSTNNWVNFNLPSAFSSVPNTCDVLVVLRVASEPTEVNDLAVYGQCTATFIADSRLGTESFRTSYPTLARTQFLAHFSARVCCWPTIARSMHGWLVLRVG